MSQAEPWADKWQVDGDLSGGGQGTTRLVSAVEEPKRRAVLKILNKQDQPQARRRMHREVVALQTLAKSGIKVPTVLDGNTHEFEKLSVPLYFVMDFIDGNTLTKEVQSRGRLNLDHAVAITRDLCHTMSAAHRDDILHRDLKPANVIVRDFDRADAVIVDYGLSFNHSDAQDSVTQTGEKIKNELIALPEANALGGDRRDKRSDVTNLAAIFYFCLTSHLPGQLRDGNNRPPHRWQGYSVRECLGDDPRCRQVESLLDVAFALEVENRIQTCDELSQRLVALLEPPSPDEDPGEVAAQLRAALRQGDRKTMLAEYGGYVNKWNSWIQRAVEEVASAIAPFGVGIGGFDLGNRLLPDGLDKLVHGLSVTVTLPPHDIARAILFVFAAKGRNCVLMQHILANAAAAGIDVKPGSTWTELDLFDPHGEVAEDRFRQPVRNSLNRVMRELTGTVINL